MLEVVMHNNVFILRVEQKVKAHGPLGVFTFSSA